jgi:uncharacterized membrane protein
MFKQMRRHRAPTGAALLLRSARSRLGQRGSGPLAQPGRSVEQGEDVMNKMIFVGFDTEKKAYEGVRALHELHRDGTITLYNDAVVVKDRNGEVVVRQRPDAGGIGTLGGMITGGLIGLLGGPVGAAVGAGAGTLMGFAFDLSAEGIAKEFVSDVGEFLEPGKAVAIAEIDEHWQVPLDTRMEVLGGKLLRRTRTQIADAYMERDIEAARQDLASLEAEKLVEVKASQGEKSKKKIEKLQAKIDAAKRSVEEKEIALATKMRAVQEEQKERLAVLEAQKATAIEESQTLLERRLAAVQDEYEQRVQLLNKALERRKAARSTSTA